MQEKLIFYIGTHPLNHLSWAIVSADHIVTQHGSPETLAALSADKDVIVMVPAEDVLLASVTLPKMNRSRLLQALPYALEEQLISDVDTLHFVPGENQADGSLPVAVVAKTKMQSWLTLLNEWGIQPDVMIPVMLALPVEENVWHVAVNETAVIRMNEYQGFACDKNNLQELLVMALAAAKITHPVIHIKDYTTDEQALALNVQADVTIDKVNTGQWLGDLSQQAIHTPLINLLQGVYKNKKNKLPQMRKMWNGSLYLGIAWLFLLFLYPGISYWILGQRAHTINSQIEDIYKRNFPQSSSIVAPKLRLGEKLQTLTSQATDNKLLQWIDYLGKGVAETPGIELKRLDFQNNQLSLDLIASSSDDFTRFTEFLKRQGLRVKQQNANLTGEHISAVVVID